MKPIFVSSPARKKDFFLFAIAEFRRWTFIAPSSLPLLPSRPCLAKSAAPAAAFLGGPPFPTVAKRLSVFLPPPPPPPATWTGWLGAAGIAHWKREKKYLRSGKEKKNKILSSLLCPNLRDVARLSQHQIFPLVGWVCCCRFAWSLSCAPADLSSSFAIM